MAVTIRAQIARPIQICPMRVFCMSASQACGCQAFSLMPVACAVVVAKMPSSPIRRIKQSQGSERSRRVTQGEW